MEGEANFAAGRLLFLREEFRDRLLSGPISYDRIKTLSAEFGNTQTSTLWRAIECLDVAAFGIVSQHPRRRLKPDKPKARYLVGSKTFPEQFDLDEETAFALLRGYCKGQRGPIGDGEVVLQDRNGDEQIFTAETFFNGYDALTLAIHKTARIVTVAVP